jgi:pimeloyl-ACP methyl ester carboxylesterase
MKRLIRIFICVFIVQFAYGQKKIKLKSETIHFTADDGVKITADQYLISDTDAPFIILFHQAGYSRGEYREIAPKLNKLGFNSLAVDQRSGKEVNGIVNKTNKEAKKLKKSTEYVDAIPDIEAAFLYVRDEMKAKKIVVWGSSYSAALVFYLASKYADEIDGVLSFSPGEYFEIDGKKIKSFAVGVKSPVFITSAKNENKQWKEIYDSLTSDKSFFVPNQSGKHGSKALWESNFDNKEYWKAVTEFLDKIK